MKLFTSITSAVSRFFAPIARLFRRQARLSCTASSGEQSEDADHAPKDFSELPEPVLSIDLGAAYTKVSYRRRIQPGSRYVEQSQVLVLDGRSLIPSIGIRDSAGQWYFGAAAAQLRPAPDWQIHANWKKELFDSNSPSPTASDVASRFFSWLRNSLQPVLSDLGSTRVRVALPAFEDFGRKARSLKDCMAKGGWNRAMIHAIREPHANLIGLTSRGKNHVTWRADGPEPVLNYGIMLNQFGAIERARRFYVNRTRTKRYLRAMVLDIGAYTSDIAPLIIDLSAGMSEYGDGIEALNPTSLRLGISAALDDPIFAALLSVTGFQRFQFKFDELELMKEKLYSGEAYYITADLTVGTESHQQLIQTRFDQFAGSLWESVSPVAIEHKPEWIAMTGGGSQIVRLREAIRRRIEGAEFTVAQLGEGDAFHADEPLPQEQLTRWTVWSESGVELKRLATALGGASVLLDVPCPSPCHERRDWDAAEAADQPDPPPTQRQCSCGGMNPDCDICSGTGYVPVES